MGTNLAKFYYFNDWYCCYYFVGFDHVMTREQWSCGKTPQGCAKVSLGGARELQVSLYSTTAKGFVIHR